MGQFFKIWPNLSQNWLKFKKILRKIGSFVQNLAQNWADWYMNGLLFLEKLVFVWVYFQIPWRHIPTKTKLEYPPELSSIHDGKMAATTDSPFEISLASPEVNQNATLGIFTAYTFVNCGHLKKNFYCSLT